MITLKKEIIATNTTFTFTSQLLKSILYLNFYQSHNSVFFNERCSLTVLLFNTELNGNCVVYIFQVYTLKWLQILTVRTDCQSVSPACTSLKG